MIQQGEREEVKRKKVEEVDREMRRGRREGLCRDGVHKLEAS